MFQVNSLFATPAKRTVALCLLLIAATLALYVPVVHNDFVNFDDDTYILYNPHIRAGLTWNTVKWACTHFEQGNWQPLPGSRMRWIANYSACMPGIIISLVHCCMP